jgi:hypothetical protein
LDACKKKTSTGDALSVITQQQGTSSPVQIIATPADSSILKFNELSAKLRITAAQNGQPQSFNCQLRWKKGEKIWLSMSLLGVEGIRVLITPDSIKWIDRINNEYLLKPYSYTTQALKLDIPFEALERVLIGLPALMDKSIIKTDETDVSQEWRGVYQNTFNTAAFFSKINNMLIEYSADDPMQQRSLLCRYGDFRAVSNRIFAFDRYMKFILKKDNIEIQAKFVDVSVMENLSFPFDIPSKYKRIE